MQTKFLLTAAGLTALSAAQITNIDDDAAARVAVDEVNYLVTVATNKQFYSDLDAVGTALPTSVVAQVTSNPAILVDALNTAYEAPTWATAIPTSVAKDLASILAKPISAENDVYSLLTAGPASSILVSNTAVPASVQTAILSDPLGFLEYAVTAETIPFATNFPATLQSQIGSLVNQALKTVAADYEAGAPAPTVTSSRATRAASGTGAPAPTLTTRPSTCPVCPSASTVIVTVTGPASSSSIPTSKPISPSTPILSTGAIIKPTVSGLSSAYINPAAPVSAPPAAAAPPQSQGTNKPAGVASASGVKPSGSGVKSGGTGAVFTSKTGAPVAFTGAAAPMRTAAVGLVGLAAAGVMGAMQL